MCFWIPSLSIQILEDASGLLTTPGNAGPQEGQCQRPGLAEWSLWSSEIDSLSSLEIWEGRQVLKGQNRKKP